MADRLRYVGTWLSLVEHSLGVRGVGSSNLPVPTNFSFTNALHPANPFAADPRSTPTCAAASAKAPSRDCEGGEAKTRHSAVRIFPSRPISVLPTPFIRRIPSWPTHEAPQPAPQRQRRRRVETARGARRRLAIRQFESARPDQFNFLIPRLRSGFRLRAHRFAALYSRPQSGSSSNLPVPTNSFLSLKSQPSRSRASADCAGC